MRGIAPFAEVTTGAGGTTKTLVQLLAGTNHPIRLTEASISFDGIDNLAEPIRVELIIQTSAGTASTLTPVKVMQAHSGTLDTAAQETFTAEPTKTDVVRRWNVHPQGVPWVYSVPDPQQFELAGGQRIGLQTIMPSGASAVNAVGYLEFDE